MYKLALVCVCMSLCVLEREREAWMEGIFDKLKSHDVLKLRAEKKGMRERGKGKENNHSQSQEELCAMDDGTVYIHVFSMSLTKPLLYV